MSILFVKGFDYATDHRSTDKILASAKLSVGALGMVIYLINYWDINQSDGPPEINQDHLFERFSESSKHHVRKVLKELKDKEYLEYKSVSHKGRFITQEWCLFFNRIFMDSLD